MDIEELKAVEMDLKAEMQQVWREKGVGAEMVKANSYIWGTECGDLTHAQWYIALEEMRAEVEMTVKKKTKKPTVKGFSSPKYWMSLHQIEEAYEEQVESQVAEGSHDPEVGGEPPEFYRARAVFSGFQELEGEPQGPQPALPPGADEHGPYGPNQRVAPPRNPRTCPDLTEDEIDGTRYPGEGVDLSQFSDYERMSRLCQCYEAQLRTMEINNNREGYEFFEQQLVEVDGLRLIASDVRPGEEEG